MFFPELDILRSHSPQSSRVLDALDAYLGRVEGAARSTLNPRIIASEVNTPIAEVVALLEAGVEAGIFRHRFHLLCPVEQAGLAWLESLANVPESFDCDICTQGPHKYRPEDVEVRYAVVRQHAAV
jgi:hypothetical protein